MLRVRYLQEISHWRCGLFAVLGVTVTQEYFSRFQAVKQFSKNPSLIYVFPWLHAPGAVLVFKHFTYIKVFPC